MPIIRIELTPKQKELREAIEKFPITFFGGAKGGGKSHGLRNILLLRRFEYPNSVGVIFRKNYPELERNHIGPLFAQFPALREHYNDSKKTLTLPGVRSELRFLHCESLKTVGLHQGAEYHDLGIEEAGEWEEEVVFRLLGSNRSARPGIPARCILTGNPGGIGHKWLKRLFIERRYFEGERAEDYHFIPAKVFDNPALLENDPRYVERLKAEKNPLLRKAYLEGDWDIAAGQFFSELNREVHVVKPFEIPEHWPVFASYDYGFSHPAAWSFFAVNEEGIVFVYHAYNEARLSIEEQANRFFKVPHAKRISVVWAGRDCWSDTSWRMGAFDQKALQKGRPPTIAEEFQKHGIYLRAANVDRIQGANLVRRYLEYKIEKDSAGNNVRIGPRVRIFGSCEALIECLFSLTHDPLNPEDVLKIDAKDGDPNTGDDPYDCFRYGIMSRPIHALTPKERVQDRYQRRKPDGVSRPWTVT